MLHNVPTTDSINLQLCDYNCIEFITSVFYSFKHKLQLQGRIKMVLMKVLCFTGNQKWHTMMWYHYLVILEGIWREFKQEIHYLIIIFCAIFRYQKRIYLLLCLPAILCAFHKLGNVFLVAKADHRYESIRSLIKLTF